MEAIVDRQAAAEAFYGPLLASPEAARRVGWDGAAAHGLRLAALVDAILPAAPTRVLDAGAGEGALLPRLRAAGFAGSYRGEDVLPAMVERARATHAADAAATFACADLFAPGPTASAVVCSGALNTVAGPDHDAEVAAALTALWARTEAVLALDLAVADRHAPGVGLALADLPRAWAHARTLAPFVSVREDVVPGEALLVLARSRASALGRWVPDALVRAGLLLDAGEGEAAVALVASDARPAADLVRGRAAAARGALDEAERALLRAVASGDPTTARAAQLELAPLRYRQGQKGLAEALLRDLVAAGSDDARAHLALLLAARGARAEATGVAEAIGDAWIRREIQARLASAPGMVKRQRPA